LLWNNNGTTFGTNIQFSTPLRPAQLHQAVYGPPLGFWYELLVDIQCRARPGVPHQCLRILYIRPQTFLTNPQLSDRWFDVPYQDMVVSHRRAFTSDGNTSSFGPSDLRVRYSRIPLPDFTRIVSVCSRRCSGVFPLRFNLNLNTTLAKPFVITRPSPASLALARGALWRTKGNWEQKGTVKIKEFQPRGSPASPRRQVAGG
jgi:hypothetical protein